MTLPPGATEAPPSDFVSARFGRRSMGVSVGSLGATVSGSSVTTGEKLVPLTVPWFDTCATSPVNGSLTRARNTTVRLLPVGRVPRMTGKPEPPSDAGGASGLASSPGLAPSLGLVVSLGLASSLGLAGGSERASWAPADPTRQARASTAVNDDDTDGFAAGGRLLERKRTPDWDGIEGARLFRLAGPLSTGFRIHATIPAESDVEEPSVLPFVLT